MQEIRLFEDKEIELKSGEKYYVIKQTIFNEVLYLLANKLDENDEITDELAILKVTINENELILTLEDDLEVLGNLMQLFSELFK